MTLARSPKKPASTPRPAAKGKAITKAKKAKAPAKPKPRKAPVKRKPAPRPKARAWRSSGGRRRRGGTTIEHTCGHSQEHHFPGAKWKAERMKTEEAARECTACWSEKQAADLEMLAEIEDLPPMKGTPRQIQWARSIRAKGIIKLRTEASQVDRARRDKALPPAGEEFLSKALSTLLKHSSAKWWIDSRDTNPLELLDFDAQDHLEAIRQEALLAPEPYCPF